MNLQWFKIRQYYMSNLRSTVIRMYKTVNDNGEYIHILNQTAKETDKCSQRLFWP